MKYAALIYGADDAGPKPGTPEFDQMMQDYGRITEHYRERGAMLGGEPLQHSSTATSVRVRDGKTETMDGPFAETKERLGGFYLFDCKDLDEAIELAAMIPGAKWGTIEVRPIMDMG